MRYRFLVLSCALAVSACATQPVSSPQPPPIVTASPSQPDPITPADILSKQPPEVRGAIKNHEPDDNWPQFTGPDWILLPYAPKQKAPTVICTTRFATDINLEPGETVVDVITGDSQRWQTNLSSWGNPTMPTPVVSIKPQWLWPDMTTDLKINTTKRKYKLLVRARKHGAVSEINWYYPQEILADMKVASAPKTQQTSYDQSPLPDPRSLRFGYEISGPNVAWRPVRVFDDGQRIYIQMPQSMAHANAPVLMGDDNEMLNYRTRDGYYITDQLADRLKLISGVGRDQDKILIEHTGQQ